MSVQPPSSSPLRSPELSPPSDPSAAQLPPPAAVDALEGPLRLNFNENRLGLPDSVRRAVMDAFAFAHHYPDDSTDALTLALARRHGIDREGIVHSHGSTEILRMAVPAHAIGKPRVRIVQAEPTFEHLARYAEPFGADLVSIPLEEGTWAHDLPRMREEAEAWDGPVLVYVCNPNNPTGTLTPIPPLRAWIDQAPENHLFIVDEAYHEFAEDPAYESLSDLAQTRENVLVLRTFSKVYAMAGLCVGYAIAHPTVARRLRKFRTGRGPSVLSSQGALAAMEDTAFLRRSVEANRASRDFAYAVLEELDLEYMPSHTNFVMHYVGGSSERYVERMLEAGLWVGRPFLALPEYNRITLGLREDMERWAAALRDFRRKGWI